MSILLITIIVLIIILIIILGTFVLGFWRPATLPSANISEMTNTYNIPSAWTGGAPTDDSSCQVYTFVSTNGDIPQPSLAALSANQTGKFNISPLNATCTDDDQIFAQKMFHVCRYGQLSDIPITQYSGCPLRSGGFTKIDGFYEEYYNMCSNQGTTGTGNGGQTSTLTEGNSTRCAGTVALITYNFTNTLASATCLKDPVYTIEGSTVIMSSTASVRLAHSTITGGNPPVSSGGCSITEVQNGFPSQLFRITRFEYDSTNKSLKQNNTGPWVRITHRPSGLCIAPYTLGSNGKTPSVSAFNPTLSPILVESSSFGNNGAWFYITPVLSMPSGEASQVPANQVLTALPQLIWAPTIQTLGPIKNNDILWEYVTNSKNNVHSLVPFTVNGSNNVVYNRTSMIPFITFPAAASSNLPSIKPPTDPTSPYYPRFSNAIAVPGGYADLNKANPASGCFGFVPGFVGFPITIGSQNTIQPVTKTSQCYKDYVLNLYAQYAAAITGAKQRIIAESGAFNYIDLVLLPIVLNDSSNFYNPN